MSLDIKKLRSISNTCITDNSSPARILSFNKWICSPQMSCCVLFWCSTLHRSTNHEVSSVAAFGLPALL